MPRHTTSTFSTRTPPRSTPRYHINVFYSRDDKAFIADVPDLKYCSAHGPTPEKAVREVMIAMEAWLASAKADKKRIPKPHYRPAICEGLT